MGATFNIGPRIRKQIDELVSLTIRQEKMTWRKINVKTVKGKIETVLMLSGYSLPLVYKGYVYVNAIARVLLDSVRESRLGLEVFGTSTVLCSS